MVILIRVTLPFILYARVESDLHATIMVLEYYLYILFSSEKYTFMLLFGSFLISIWTPFSTSCKTNLVWWICHFVCVGKYFPFILYAQFCQVKYSWLAFFPFSTLIILSCCLLSCKVSAEKSTDSLKCCSLYIPSYVTSLFSLTAVKILSLWLLTI